MVIGSVSILYWRVGNIMISKMLALVNVAEYELAFRIFSIFQILPVVASATIYPQFIKYVNEKNEAGLKQLYTLLFIIYTSLAMLAYSFIFSFASLIIPLAFGNNYPEAADCLQQMFLSFLIMPTVLLQANLIVAFGLERIDMRFNLLSLIINVVLCFIGLHLYKSLAVVNYAILISLLAFHLLQDVVLVKKRIITLSHCLVFYLIISCTVISFHFLPGIIGLYHFYILFTAIVLAGASLIGVYNKKTILVLIGKRLVKKNTLC
jgi:O-antigen/teichoic acid export membrane protein